MFHYYWTNSEKWCKIVSQNYIFYRHFVIFLCWKQIKSRSAKYKHMTKKVVFPPEKLLKSKKPKQKCRFHCQIDCWRNWVILYLLGFTHICVNKTLSHVKVNWYSNFEDICSILFVSKSLEISKHEYIQNFFESIKILKCIYSISIFS